MADKKRVYIIRHGSEAPDPDDEIYSSMKKLAGKLNKDISYSALSARLRRARKTKGKARIWMEDDCGNPVIVEIRDVE